LIETSRNLRAILFAALMGSNQFGRYVRTTAGHSDAHFLGYPLSLG